MIFSTTRLTVRQLNTHDLDDFHDMQSNPNVMQFIKATMNYKQSKKELDRFIGYYSNTSIQFDIWAIEEKNNQDFIGICGIYKNELSESEIAYRLREIYWGNGYGKEIAKELIQYGFQNNILELYAYVREGNIGSQKILEQFMQFEKEFYSEKGKCMERKYSLKNYL